MFRSRMPGLGAAFAVAVAMAGLVGCQPEEIPASDAPSSASPRQPSSSAAPERSDGPDEKPAGHTLVDVATAGGLRKLTGDGAVSDIPVDPGEIRDGMTLVVSNFEAPEGASGPVLFEGVDHVPEDTNKRREHLFRGMLEHIQWDPELGTPQAQPYDPGPRGGSVECLLASLSEDGNVICGWADDSTSGVALFPDSTLAEAARLFVAMRADLET